MYIHVVGDHLITPIIATAGVGMKCELSTGSGARKGVVSRYLLSAVSNLADVLIRCTGLLCHEEGQCI